MSDKKGYAKSDKSGDEKDKVFGKRTLKTEEEKLLVQLNYDLLQIPSYIEKKRRKGPKVDTKNEDDWGESTGVPIDNVSLLPALDVNAPRKKKKKMPVEDKNPAPHSKDFRPDWVDTISGAELALAENYMVQDKRIQDKNAIVFDARVKGKDRCGNPRMPPSLHQKVELMDVRTGEIAAFGYVSEAYFTRKRVMGVLILRPLHWVRSMPLYQ